MSARITLYACLLGLLVLYHGVEAQSQDQKSSGPGGLLGGLFGKASPTPAPNMQNLDSRGRETTFSPKFGPGNEVDDDEDLVEEGYDGDDDDYDDSDDVGDYDDEEYDEEMEGDESYEQEEMSPEETLGILLEDHYVARQRCADAEAEGTKATSEDCKYLDELNVEAKSLIQQIFA